MCTSSMPYGQASNVHGAHSLSCMQKQSLQLVFNHLLYIIASLAHTWNWGATTCNTIIQYSIKQRCIVMVGMGCIGHLCNQDAGVPCGTIPHRTLPWYWLPLPFRTVHYHGTGCPYHTATHHTLVVAYPYNAATHHTLALAYPYNAATHHTLALACPYLFLLAVCHRAAGVKACQGISHSLTRSSLTFSIHTAWCLLLARQGHQAKGVDMHPPAHTYCMVLTA